LEGFDYVEPEPVPVGKRIPRIENSTVNLAVEMLNKMTVDHWITFSQNAGPVYVDFHKFTIRVFLIIVKENYFG
jgi:hypothetical protein